VYPHGCDVCNHLSLFLCVADYDKLLPGEQYLLARNVLLGPCSAPVEDHLYLCPSNPRAEYEPAIAREAAASLVW
jgi:hypothetical protein